MAGANSEIGDLYNTNSNTGLVNRALDVSHYIDYRARRFLQRFHTGFDVHAGEIARWFVLTESDEAITLGLDLVQKFNELVRYLRRNYGPFEYCCVRHRQGDKERINLHVVYFGSYISQQVIEDWWWKNYSSHRSRMGVVKSRKKQAWYLAKYLSRGDFERYHFSNGWVFKGWIGFSGWIKRELGQYPTREMIRGLAKLGEKGRARDLWFGLFLGIKKSGWKSFIRAQNEKWKAIQAQHSLKKKTWRSRVSRGGVDDRQLKLWG